MKTEIKLATYKFGKKDYSQVDYILETTDFLNPDNTQIDTNGWVQKGTEINNEGITYIVDEVKVLMLKENVTIYIYAEIK